MGYSKKKYFIYVCCILLASYFIFLKGVQPATEKGSSDFYNYYVSSKLLLEGESISSFYNNKTFAERAVEIGLSNHTKFAPFPPATAFLYLPLTFFSPFQAKRIWLVINMLLLVVVAVQARVVTRLSLIEILFILSLFAVPIANNLRLGQSYLLFTCLLFEFLRSIRLQKLGLAGSLIGFAAALKYFPIVYMLYSLPSNSKKQYLGLILAIVLIGLLPVITDGVQVYTTFFNHINGNLLGQGQFSFTFQSLDALLANLFIYDNQYNPEVIIDLPLLKPVFKLGFILTILLIAIRARKKEKEWNNFSVGICILAAAIMLPASASYHLLLLIPSTMFIVKSLSKEREVKRALFLLFVLIFCNLLPHHIPTFNSHLLNTITHFPRLYGLIATFVLLLYIQKQRLTENG